jgi:hypothetical protein
MIASGADVILAKPAAPEAIIAALRGDSAGDVAA